ncbi:AAA family ATPase [Gracilibacillus xinjiangensis]|uniref:Nuclease SbcCD subunit C n=1 Tax=Gracilibacillus xinjiangensis TaxID=1193282 RepID=A0ABV8WXT4_9BACI
MRVLTLELTAFGPYRQKQLIDFEQLGDEMIFLITGPTGAGKTTIFDAICYSIYGRASGTDRDQDTFRSHFATSDDLTSVTLTFTLHEKTYRVTRSPKQLKPKARGEGYTEEPASASLYQLNHEQKWELLETKIKDVNETLESMVNLDYEQFRKMIMIPQGEFRKLISENSKEREEVLQKIFRTYFYRDMTEKMKSDAKMLKEKSEKLEWKLEQERIKISTDMMELEEDQPIIDQIHAKIKELYEEQKELQEKQEQLKQRQQQLEQDYYHKQQIVELYDQLDRKVEESKQLQQREPQIIEQKEVLQLAKLAEQLIPLEQQLLNREEELHQQQKRSKNIQQQLLDKQTEFEREEVQYNQLKREEAARDRLKIDLLQKKESLGKIKEYMNVKEQFNKLASIVTTDQEKMKKTELALEQLNKEKEQSYQLNDQIHHLQQTIQQAKFNKEKSHRQLVICRDIINESSQLDIMRKDYQQVKNVVIKLNDKVDKQKLKCDQIEQGYHKNIAEILASKLSDGEACPVCGSVHHPKKESEKVNDINKDTLENERNHLHQLEEELKTMERKMYEIKEQGEARRAILNSYYQSLDNTFQSLSLDEMKETVKQLEIKEKMSEKEILDLYNSVAELQASQKSVQEIQLAIDRKKEEQTKLMQEFTFKNDQLQQLQIKIASLESQLPANIDSFKDYEQQIKELEINYNNQMKHWENSQQRYDKVKQELAEIKTISQQAAQFSLQLQQNYEKQKELFDKTLKEKNFDSVDAYKNALLTQNQQEDLNKFIEEYEETRKVNEQRIQEIKAALKDYEKPDLEPLKEELNQLKEKQLFLSKDEQSIEWLVTQLKRSEINVQSIEKDLAATSERYYHIGELANMAKGDNPQRLSFERFVLSTFLDEILIQANLRLDKMTDNRFQLIRSEELAKRGAQSGLDLEVLDHYTGRKRSVKTLSGGEGFKAALSLALGMADIIQSHAGGVQLDTLFIDEGFGTLDEISLEQAIQCLKDLQHDHRVIGVISHVSQLKESIKAKLVVQSSNDGSNAKFVLQ